MDLAELQALSSVTSVPDSRSNIADPSRLIVIRPFEASMMRLHHLEETVTSSGSTWPGK